MNDTNIKEIATACISLWDTIGGEIPGDSVAAEVMVEITVDADRLKTMGFVEAAVLKDQLIEEVGYNKFLELVTAQLPFERYEAGGDIATV